MYMSLCINNINVPLRRTGIHTMLFKFMLLIKKNRRKERKGCLY